jgi:hypothetical protein
MRCILLPPLSRHRRNPSLMTIDEPATLHHAAAPGARGNFMAYPVSRLASRIVPQDLTNFKSRGISKVERELQQELIEMREHYLAVIDAFNWNKLIYEAQLGFEPVVGETYHLYEMRGQHHLSMIEPEKWHQRWIGTFKLNADQRWQPVQTAPDFNLRDFTANAGAAEPFTPAE